VAIAALFAAGSVGSAALPAAAQTVQTGTSPNTTGTFNQKDPNITGVETQVAGFPVLGAQTPNPASQLQGGQGATGNNTFWGHIDQPAANVPLYPGATLALSGWALDRAAPGWTGIDGVQVYNGVMGQGGTSIGSGGVGLARPDIARQYGPTAAQSGWWAQITVPRLSAGNQYAQLPVNVYFHTPTKGWWYAQGAVLDNTDQRVRYETFANGILQAPGYFYSSDFIPKFIVNSSETHGRAVNQICGYADDTNSADGSAGIQNVEVILDGDPGNVLPAVDLGPASMTGCTGIAAPRGYTADSGWQMIVNETIYPPQVPVDGGPPARCTYANCSKGSYQWPVGNHTYYVVATTNSGKVSTITIPFQVPS
jgi:hypothetical protein